MLQNLLISSVWRIVIDFVESILMVISSHWQVINPVSCEIIQHDKNNKYLLIAFCSENWLSY